MDITKENYKSMLGYELTTISWDPNSWWSVNVVKNAFVAAIDPEVGVTIKNMDDPDPEKFVYCWIAKNSLLDKAGKEKRCLTILNTIKQMQENGAGVHLEKLCNIVEGREAIAAPFGFCPF